MALSRRQARASATLFTWPPGRNAITPVLGPGSSITAFSARGVPLLVLSGRCSAGPPASLLLFTSSGCCVTASLDGPAVAPTISVLPTYAQSARATRARSGPLPHRWDPVQNGASLASARGGRPPSAGLLCRTSASIPTSSPVPRSFGRLSALSLTLSALGPAPSAAALSVATAKRGRSISGPGVRRSPSSGRK